MCNAGRQGPHRETLSSRRRSPGPGRAPAALLIAGLASPLRAADPLRSASGRWPRPTRTRPRSCGSARRRRAGRGASRATHQSVGPPRPGLPAPHPRRAGLRGPEVLRPRRRGLGGRTEVDGRGPQEGPLRPRGQHDHPAARQEPVLHHAQDDHPQAARARGGALDGAGAVQAADPRAVPERHRVGRRRSTAPRPRRGAGTASPRRTWTSDGGRGPGGDDPQPAPDQPARRPGAPRARAEARAVADGGPRLRRAQPGRLGAEPPPEVVAEDEEAARGRSRSAARRARAARHARARAERAAERRAAGTGASAASGRRAPPPSDAPPTPSPPGRRRRPWRVR